MNPIQELESRIKLLHEELDEDIEGQKFICYQHKKILMHVMEMSLCLIESDPVARVKIFNKFYQEFNTALIEAQNMAERMEAKLIKNKEQLIKK